MLSRGPSIKAWLGQNHWNGIGALAGIAAVLTTLALGILALTNKPDSHVNITPTAAPVAIPPIVLSPSIGNIFNKFLQSDDSYCCEQPSQNFLIVQPNSDRPAVRYQYAVEQIRKAEVLILNGKRSNDSQSLEQAVSLMNKIIYEYIETEMIDTEYSDLYPVYGFLLGTRGVAYLSLSIFKNNVDLAERSVQDFQGAWYVFFRAGMPAQKKLSEYHLELARTHLSRMDGMP